jgi:hypothetical protein
VKRCARAGFGFWGLRPFSVFGVFPRGGGGGGGKKKNF